jgi:two-component system chemotaxis response regulator CheY
MPKKILIVDDAPVIRFVLRDMLELGGFEVVGEGENGIEAVQKFLDLKPDLVTLDITMPEKDGITALMEIKALDKNAKVIMVTALDERDSLIDAIKNGASDYIMKPFEQERVLSAVKNLLEPEQ